MGDRIYAPFASATPRGEVKLNIMLYNGRVCFKFHRPVDIFHCTADEARALAKALLENADKLEGRDKAIILTGAGH